MAFERRRPFGIVTLALMVCGSTWAAFGLPASRPLNLVVVTLDTTRADRLSPYGNMDVRLPHLERIAANGVVFDRASSVGALTLPAHTSLFTGLLPPVHGVRDNADPPLVHSRTTLAEVLQGRGYRTGAFVGAGVLGSDRGLSQGFDTYSAVTPGAPAPRRVQRPADEVVGEALRWLERDTGEPFLLWVHLYDPHRPYAPPPPFDRLPDPYLGEIAFADAQIGVLLAVMERLGVNGRTVLIVAGDHGESLGEHGEADHGIFIYESVLRVPLIIRVPGYPPRRVSELVRLVDVMPTALRLLGMPAVPTNGADLTGLMRGSQALGVDAYAESIYPRRFGWSPLHAIRDGRFKYIEAPRPELYDLDHDPFELRNIVHEHPRTAAAMQSRLAAIVARGTSSDALVDPDVRDRLAALGYVFRSTPTGTLAAGPDPKDCVTATLRALDCRKVP